MSLLRISILNRDTISLCVTVIFSLVLFFYNDSPQVNAVRADITDLVNWVLGPQKWYKNILIVKEQNRILTDKITQLQLMNSRLDHFRIENTRLREMLKFSDSHTWSLIPANVTNQNAETVQAIIADVGKQENILKNLPVIDMNGLLGKTIVVGEQASQIQIITDKNFRVSIRIGEDRSLGNFVPTHGKYGILEGVRKSTQVKVGDIAYTSGISNIYPGEIPVAIVISTTVEDDKAFLGVIVEILAELENLNYIFIIQ